MFWWDLSGECWTTISKFCLFWGIVFGLTAFTGGFILESELFLWENGALGTLFGGMQTYAWIES